MKFHHEIWMLGVELSEKEDHLYGYFFINSTFSNFFKRLVMKFVAQQQALIGLIAFIQKGGWRLNYWFIII